LRKAKSVRGSRRGMLQYSNDDSVGQQLSAYTHNPATIGQHDFGP